MKIQDSVALVTGANRGLGLAFARALLAGGARKVYAAARDPASVNLAGVQPIRLDVTKPAEIDKVAGELGDVDAVASVCTSWHDFTQEDDFSALLGNGYVHAADAGQQLRGPGRLSRGAHRAAARRRYGVRRAGKGARPGGVPCATVHGP